MFTNMPMGVWTLTGAHMHVDTYKHACACVNVGMYGWTCGSAFLCGHMSTCAHVWVCTFMCVDIVSVCVHISVPVCEHTDECVWTHWCVLQVCEHMSVNVCEYK
jgi:hypothetical protein